jgi:NAD(P)-dependent dehydrogenase (short-subunit alcohol dehydrogenase family)
MTQVNAPLPNEQGGRPRTAIVTGSDSGIGRAIAAALAGDGVDVGVTYHSDADEAAATAQEVRDRGARAAVRKLDLADLPVAADAIDELADELGGVDVLVNCAGTRYRENVHGHGLRHLAVRPVRRSGWSFACSQRAAKRMIAAGAGGRIITITSVHEHAPKVGAAPYCAAKAAPECSRRFSRWSGARRARHHGELDSTKAAVHRQMSEPGSGDS